MSSLLTRGHVFLSNQKLCLLGALEDVSSQEDIPSCSVGRHVSLSKKKTCLPAHMDTEWVVQKINCLHARVMYIYMYIHTYIHTNVIYRPYRQLSLYKFGNARLYRQLHGHWSRKFLLFLQRLTCGSSKSSMQLNMMSTWIHWLWCPFMT